MHEFTLTDEQTRAWVAGDTYAVDRALAGLGFGDELRGVEVQQLSETVAGPGLAGRLDLRRAGEDHSVDLAIWPALVAAITDPERSDELRIVVSAAADLPRLVAEMVDLGPRPFDPLADPIVLPPEIVEGYVGTGLSTDALAELHETFDGVLAPAALDAVLGEGATRWRLTLWSAADADDPRQVIDIVDAGDGGLWLLTGDDDGAAVFATPVNASAVWLLLGRFATEPVAS